MSTTASRSVASVKERVDYVITPTLMSIISSVCIHLRHSRFGYEKRSSALLLMSVVTQIEKFRCLSNPTHVSVIPAEGEDWLCEHS